MPLIVIDAGELTGHLAIGAEQRVYASLPEGHAGGSRVVIDAVHVYYRVESPAPGVVPNVDPWRGYENESPPAPNGEDAHPHDDATGHVTRTHEDFGPRLPRSHDPRDRHAADLPGRGDVGC